jgi:trans-aconitate methyltransferase
VEEVVVAQDWNPTRYAAFRDLRLRPALDLRARGRVLFPFTRVFFILERS